MGSWSIAMLLGIATMAGAEASLVGPFTRETYPQAVIDRPLTLPAGMVEGELGTQFTSRSSASNGGYYRVDDWDLDLTLRVGITDRLQAEVGTGFSLDHVEQTNLSYFGTIGPFDSRPSTSSWSRRVPFSLSFLALDTEDVDTALTLKLPFEAFASRTIHRPNGPTYRAASSDGRVLRAVGLAAPTRWRLLPWLWLRAGQNLFAYDTLLQAGVFNLDLGLGVQAHPMLAFTLDTRFATLGVVGSGRTFSTTVADRGTADLAMIFTPTRCVDFVGDVMLPDIGRRFDSYGLRTAVRVRF